MTGKYLFWPLGKPLPWGWHLAGPLSGNHGAYSILIKRDFIKTIKGWFA